MSVEEYKNSQDVVIEEVKKIHADLQETLEAEIVELRNQLAECQKDAERYKWLRGQHWSESNICVVLNPKEAVKLGHDCPSNNRLDEAIDKAMSEKG